MRGVEYAESVFEFLSPGIGHIYLYMAVEGVLFLVLAIIIEVREREREEGGSVSYWMHAVHMYMYVRVGFEDLLSIFVA